MIQPTKTWRLAAAAPAAFVEQALVHPILAQALYNRGLHSAAEAAAFLAIDDAVVENPYRLRDMTPAVQRILRAIEQGEVICVYGDFDADGVTSTVLLVKALQAAGARVGPYIPNRVDEGYGLNMEAIDKLARQARLMITVDCGIRAVAEVQHAMELGLDVIITDHHSVGAILPPALAVINPRRADCPSRFERLAGVGVAYRLAQAVLRAAAQQPWSRLATADVPEIEEELLDLVAIGTVADMMPLQLENRSLVRRGLAQLNRTQRPGLELLMQKAGVSKGHADTAAISFRIAPRINAAGRMAHAKLAYDLLRTDDVAEAYSHAERLETLNQARRELTVKAEAEAEAQIAAQLADNTRMLLASSRDFQSGIVGLVAGKLTDRFYLPAVVIEEGESESRGSARSIPEVDISAALDQVSHLLVRHGGHQGAAGFTVATERLPEFTIALQETVDAILAKYDELRPELILDATAHLDELNWGLVEQFARLEPTGRGNESPVLLIPDVRVREARSVGGGKHLKLILDGGPGQPVMDAIAFGLGDLVHELPQNTLIDVAGELNVNEWNGRRNLQILVKDLRTAEEAKNRSDD
ncbi:MAG: single-stranded-DNA-specific exonuclease RecJ [Caldilineaceae bacterium]|nr:single-stranded-DNA-specific exonuclease RecJ [Caldilineaceae bacterium]